MSSIQRSIQKSKYGATHNLRSVVFICEAPTAVAVTLVGDFNSWNPFSHPQQQPDGGWMVRLEMKHGHHRYAYLVDGILTLDPRAMGVTRNDEGQRVALI